LFLYLAPLRGITDYIFRTVYSSHFPGFDCAIAPFVTSVKGKIVKASHLKDLLPENNRKLPVIPQVIGKNPEEFIVMAAQLKEMGYTSFNWNLGCPFPQVTRNKRGSGLLPHTKTIDEFLCAVLPRISIGLSIKLRLGLVDKNDIKNVLPVLNKFPLTEIIIHPRTGSQMYAGAVDLDVFDWCVNNCAHPIVYNGDINNAAFFKTLTRRFPSVSSWMIGRHAATDPFFAETLIGRPANAQNKHARIKNFHDELVCAYGGIFKFEGHVLDKMKGMWLYLSQSFTNRQKSLKSIQKSKRLDCYREIVDTIVGTEALTFYP
jgi:tRNA-dihydrouridine synthase B